MERLKFSSIITMVLSHITASFFLLVVWTCPIVQAASFDCSKASTRVEKMICDDEALSELDKDLAFSYRWILESLVYASETIEKDRIQAEQRKWLKKDRDICSETACLRLAYETRIRQLKGERDFSDMASNMTFRYKIALSVSSEVDAVRIQTEQNKWQKAVRDSCQDTACLRSAYEARFIQLKKEAEQDIRQYWDTDEYWYFFAKKLKDDQYPPTASTFFSLDGSDTLLEFCQGSAGNIWVNAQRFATQEELDLTTDMSSGVSSHVWQPLCNGNTVRIENDRVSAKFGNPITRVVIRTPQQDDDYRCKKCRSFAIFRKLEPPKIIEEILLEDHQEPGVPLLIPLESEIFEIKVLNDCTILAEIEGGVVRFREDGTTDAVLPPGMRLVNGEKIPQWEDEFFQSFEGEPYMSLQPMLWFFYHKIFEGENQ